MFVIDWLSIFSPVVFAIEMDLEQVDCLDLYSDHTIQSYLEEREQFKWH